VIRHLLKLVWNRKRANALVIVEIFFSFLVVFALAASALTLWTSYRRPLGFDWTDVWTVAIDVGQQTDDDFTPEQVETFAQVLREARSLDRVESAAGILSSPYTFSSSTTSMRPRGAPDEGPSFDVEVNEVTDDARDALDLDVVAGRWFDRSDDGVAWEPVVIDRDFARAFFGRVDVAGEWIDDAPRAASGSAPDRPRRRVVGVVSEFRQHGELSSGGPYLFLRKRVGDPSTRPPRNLVLEMRPGTPRGYEEVVLDRLAAAAPSWSFVARPMAESRDTSFRLRLVPLVVGAIVGAFLMAMVALGLVGVLWQNVVRRTRELGLRRATGATRQRIHRQISMELLLVTTIGLALGALLVIQLPILDLVPALSAGVFTAALGVAAGLLLALALSASLYPAWLAARVQPADALRWE
jgi:putative ABC transport system permease protein